MQAEAGAHARQVAPEQLVLQRLGAGGNDHPAAGKQGRHQVGIGLADAGPGLGDQAATFGDRLLDGGGQPLLRRPRGKARHAVGKGALRPEYAGRIAAILAGGLQVNRHRFHWTSMPPQASACRRLAPVASVGRHGARQGPVAQGLDLLGHQHRQRPRRAQLLQQQGLVQGRAFGMGGVQPADDRLLDLGTGNRRWRQPADRSNWPGSRARWTRCRRKISRALPGAGRQRRSRRNGPCAAVPAATRARHWPWRPGSPGACARPSSQEIAQHAARDTAIAVAGAARPFDFVDPQHTGDRCSADASAWRRLTSVSPWYL